MATTLNDKFAVGSFVMVGATKDADKPLVGKVVAHEGGEGELRQIRIDFGSYEHVYPFGSFEYVYTQYYLIPYKKIESGALDAFSQRSEDLVESINKFCAKFNLPKVEKRDEHIVDTVYGLSLTPTVSYRQSIGGYLEYCCWEMSISSCISRDHGWDDSLHVFEELNESMTSAWNVTKIYVAKLAEIAIDDAVSKEFD